MASEVSEGINKKVTCSQRLIAFLQENPENTDLTILMGPKMAELRTSKIVIQIFFPGLFKHISETSKKGEATLTLPSVDPTAFRTFFELMPKDTLFPEEIKKTYNLSADTIFNLLRLSEQFQQPEMENMFRSMTEPFLKDFEEFSKTEEFLQLSRENLEMLITHLHSSVNEMIAFKAVLRWGRKRCEDEGLLATNANIRSHLGKTLYLIRFPLMTNQEFAKEVATMKDLLTADEVVEVFMHFANVKNESPQCNAAPLFNANKRGDDTFDEVYYPCEEGPEIPENTVIHNLPQDSQVVDNPAAECSGNTETLLNFNVDKRVELKSIGIHGPTEKDGDYQISLNVGRIGKYNEYELMCKMETLVQARKGRVSHITLHEPIILDPYQDLHNGTFNRLQNGHYWIDFKLKGPNTRKVLGNESSRIQVLRSQVEGLSVFSRHRHCQLAALGFGPCEEAKPPPAGVVV